MDFNVIHGPPEKRNYQTLKSFSVSYLIFCSNNNLLTTNGSLSFLYNSFPFAVKVSNAITFIPSLDATAQFATRATRFKLDVQSSMQYTTKK